MKQIRSIVFHKRYFHIKIVYGIRYCMLIKVSVSAADWVWICKCTRSACETTLFETNKEMGFVLKYILQTWDTVSSSDCDWWFQHRDKKVFLCFILYRHHSNVVWANKSQRCDDLLLLFLKYILFHFLCGPSQQEECPISSCSGGAVKVPTGLFVPLRTKRAMGGESEYADKNYLPRSEVCYWKILQTMKMNSASKYSHTCTHTTT